jgi:hypothetical protein
MNEEIKVTSIEAIEGEKIKGSSKEGRFYVPVLYVLEDGRKVRKFFVDSKKKEVTGYLAKLPEQPRGMMATLSEDGKRITSTVQSLSDMMGW